MKQAIDVSKLKRLLCYESQHQSQSNEKSLVQFDYEKAVSHYFGTQSTFNRYRLEIEQCFVWQDARTEDPYTHLDSVGGGMHRRCATFERC